MSNNPSPETLLRESLERVEQLKRRVADFAELSHNQQEKLDSLNAAAVNLALFLKVASRSYHLVAGITLAENVEFLNLTGELNKCLVDAPSSIDKV